MKIYIEERAIELSKFIIATGATCKECAKKFGISESTAYKDVTQRIEKINPSLAIKVRKILDLNKAEAFLRGGVSTKEKYSNKGVF